MSEKSDSQVRLRRSFRVSELLGEGGMGVVREARADDFGGVVAIKGLKPEWLDDPRVRRRFDEEARVMSIIDHPGSLPIYGVGEDSAGGPCVIMKKVTGETLASLMGTRSREDVASVPWRRRLLNIYRDVCETMAYAHERGIVHRDLKPDNILIDEHGSVFVIDWGLASGGGTGESASADEADELVMGSPGYMAPEQVEPHRASVGPAADVFALGAILYEILTGEAPFDREGGRKAMLDAVYKDPVTPHRRNWLLSRSLSAVCMKALAKEPGRRYPSAEALLEDLRAYQEGRAVSVVRPGPIEWCLLMGRRRPIAAAVISAISLAVLAVMAFVAVQLWIDQHLADKVFDQLEIVDLDQQRIGAEMERLSSRLAALPPGAAARADLDDELQELEHRWVLREIHALNLLSSLNVLRFIHLDNEVRPLAFDRVTGALNHCLAYDHFVLASSLAEDTVEAYDEGLSNWEWSEAQLAEIKRLGRVAAEALDKAAP